MFYVVSFFDGGPLFNTYSLIILFCLSLELCLLAIVFRVKDEGNSIFGALYI